jgi:hypothetical protein
MSAIKYINLADISFQLLIMERNRHAIVKALRERKTALPPELCKELADLIDPDKLHKVGRTSIPKREVIRGISRTKFIYVDVYYRSLLGLGFADKDGKPFKRVGQAIDMTCETLGIKDVKTYRKAYNQNKEIIEQRVKTDKKLNREILEDKKHPFK